MRTFVITAALAVCAATAAAPTTIAEATSPLASAEDLATTTPIKHVVVVFQENASFDHYFGTYPIAANPRGQGDPQFAASEGTPVVNNLLPSPLNGNRDLLHDNPNQSLPFRLDRTQFVTCSQDHAYKPEQRAANGGRMNRFVQATNKEGPACLVDLPHPVPSPQVMGYFDGNTVTALWNYAQHYALNDASFATNYGPSTPGALNLVAGRTSGASPDIDKTVVDGVVIGDPDPAHDVCSGDDDETAELSGPNVGNLLTDAGVPWGWFQGGFRLDSSDDPEEACEETSMNRAGYEDEDYEPHHDPFQYFESTSNEEHVPPSSDAAIGHDDQANHQYDLEDFWTAADDGNLPAVSFLKAAGYQDGHPGPGNSNPLDEQEFLVKTLNHLQRLPEWSSTAVILAWDDSDGEYDHVPPPNEHHSDNPTWDGLYGTAADTLCMGSANQKPPAPATVFRLRCGYGQRMPLLVISPYVHPNVVDHTVTDQTSILRFIEDNWGLGQLGHDSFDADPAIGSLSNMFDFDQRREDTLLLNPGTGNPDRAPALELSAATDSVVYSDALPPISITTSDPEGDKVTVDAAGLPEGLTVAQTAADRWEISGTDQAPAGRYDVTVRATDGVLTTVQSLRIDVTRESARVGYTGDLLFPTADAGASTGPIELRARVTEDDDETPGDLGRAVLLFDLYAAGNASATPDATYAATPDAHGDAVVDAGMLATGTWTVGVRTDRSAGYFDAPASDEVPITVTPPTTGSFVTGGGWVPDSGHGLFGLDAKYRTDGSLSGQVTYVFPGPGGDQYVVTSTGWQGGGLAVSGTHATVAGTCDVTVLDAGGESVTVGSGDRFRLDVTDNGRSDTFALSVYTPDGTLYHRVGTPRAPVALGGGQVVVHR